MSVLVINPYRFAVAAVGVTDSFDRADSASTMGNADTGQTWVPNNGTWGIASNLAYEIFGSQATTVVESTIADCTILVTLTVAGDSGLCWRSTDADNHFMLSANTGTVYKKEAGGYTGMGSVAAWSNGDTVTVVLAGDSHVVKKNGTTVISYNSSFNQTATKHGLRINASSANRFNDFSVVP